MAAPALVDNSLFESLFENPHSLIVYTDLDGNFLRVNKVYAELVGKDESSFPGLNYFKLFPNDNNKKIFEEVVNSGESYLAKEKSFKHLSATDEDKKFWDWSLTLVEDEQGQGIGVLLQLIEVTRKIVVEQKLYEKIENELHHYDEELTYIIESRTKQLQETVALLQHENAERIKAQALLIKAKEDAEKANISKSQFLSRMSHELRTPLNAILGFSQLLQIHDLNEKQNSHNDEILLAGKHLLSMISDVLDLSRIEAGELSVLISETSLLKVVSESVALVNHKLNFRNITIHNFIPNDDETVLLVDETRIKEVLINVLTNAVKYNVDNGLISIGYKKLDDEHIKIYISDTGKGLTEEEQSQIFEPFNRLGAEYTDIEGVGIGLTISKKLMGLMGGSIDIESEEGKGSTFNITCRAGKNIEASTAKEINVNLTNTDHQYKILYIEDNKSNQKLIENLFHEYQNINLSISTTAEEGLKSIDNINFDLIILDINLPKMDGYDALRKIQMNADTKHVPVVALSASVSENDIKKGLKAGFNKYITKPVVLTELISIINNELNDLNL